MSGERLLLIRHSGGLWGVAQAAVRGVVRQGQGYRVRLTLEGGGGEDEAEELAADDLVGVAEGISVRPAGGVLSRYWSEPAEGLAVHGDTPLVVVDPGRPPSFLRREGEPEESDDTEVEDGDG